MSNAADAQLSQAMRVRLDALDAELSNRFDAGEAAYRLARERSNGIDALILDAWRQCIPQAAPLALFAVGGYGRRSLYPQSDVDLLVVGDEAAQAAHEADIARFIALLWDGRVQASHAVRSLTATREAASADIATQTCLLYTSDAADE